MIDVSKNIQAKYFRVFFQGPGIVLPTLGLELFPTELRGFVISSGTVAWALSLSIIPLVAFFFRHVTWRYTMGAAAVLGIHSFFTKWYCKQPICTFWKKKVCPENLTTTRFLYNAVNCFEPVCTCTCSQCVPINRFNFMVYYQKCTSINIFMNNITY